MLLFLVIRVGWYSVLVLGGSSYDPETFVLLVCSRCQWFCTILDFIFCYSQLCTKSYEFMISVERFQLMSPKTYLHHR